MSELQLLPNYTSHDKLELTAFELPQNYSLLINKLERLALGLDSAFNNLSVDRKELEVAVTGTADNADDFISPLAAERGPPPRHGHGMGDVEYSRVVSDIWIGVILTLLIVSVIFFICSCFLYHKFQQWKNSYRSNSNEPVEICRRYPTDFEAESLPSYTIVSGLPTYDDALEEFRKAGILLVPPMPVVKIFERDSSSKESQAYSTDSGFTSPSSNNNDDDNISLSSTCTCGANNTSNNTSNNSNMSGNALLTVPNLVNGAAPQVIELSPEQLAALSQKRLSLQISFNNSVRRSSRPRGIDLYRQVNRNNLLRSFALNNSNVSGTGGGTTGFDGFPQIHRSSSSTSLSMANELNGLGRSNMQRMQHRGSLY